jgi:hypothetical protein
MRRKGAFDSEDVTLARQRYLTGVGLLGRSEVQHVG